MNGTPGNARASEADEAAIERMVRLFYRNALEDAVLGPIFRSAIHDWEAHIRTVAGFWSGVIHGTDRYAGNAYAPHARLAFGPEAFGHWLAAFEAAAVDALAARDAEKAHRPPHGTALSGRPVPVYRCGRPAVAQAAGRSGGRTSVSAPGVAFAGVTLRCRFPARFAPAAVFRAGGRCRIRVVINADGRVPGRAIAAPRSHDPI
jgi:hemoglobin